MGYVGHGLRRPHALGIVPSAGVRWELSEIMRGSVPSYLTKPLVVGFRMLMFIVHAGVA